MDQPLYQEKISRILRTEKGIIAELENKLNQITGKSGILYSLVEENERLINQALDLLGLSKNSMALDVYDALISKIESDDLRIFHLLKNPRLSDAQDCQRLINLVEKIIPKTKGFFLKKEAAEKLLRQEPPSNILKILGCRSVDEALEKEDLWEIYCGLRFLEKSEWLNNTFFKQYQNLQPSDFEERKIQFRVMEQKWSAAAEKFVQKKYHNISHLKELGIIFIIPLDLNISGETLRTLSLLIHYFYEVNFYASLFKKFAEEQNGDFSKKFISLLRGDVLNELPVSEDEKDCSFLIIQRYLAKDDENDRRLFIPHINPEAFYWNLAGESLAKIEGLNFWQSLNWVGDFFKIETGGETLVSFNLVDTVMSLVKEKEMIKYLYHHQEALWNKIFAAYFSREKMEEVIRENIIKGWFRV